MKPLVSYRQTVYSPEGRWGRSLSFMLWGLLGLVVPATLTWWGLRRARPWQAKTVGILALALVALAAGIYCATPTVPVVRSHTWGGNIDSEMSVFASEVALMGEKGHLSSDMTPEALVRLPELAIEKEYLGDGYPLTNLCTGLPIRFERSPGNICTRRVDKDLYVCIYDRYGREIRMCILAPPERTAPERGGR